MPTTPRTRFPSSPEHTAARPHSPLLRASLRPLLSLLLTLALAGCGGDDGNGDRDITDTVDAADMSGDTGNDVSDINGDDASDVADATDIADTTDVSDTADISDTADATEMDAADVQDMMGPEGFGAISGLCGELDMMELTDGNPYFFSNAIDFGMDPFDDPEDLPLLTAGGQEIYADGNAGGSSLYSEIFAYEVLARCEMATLLKTETEIVYDTQGKITDLLVEIDGDKIGVSVTRAVAFPFEDPYSVMQAQELLEGKLADIQESSANVAPEDAWEKQILHVIAYGPMHAESLETAFMNIDPSVTADTIVWVTVTNGDDGFLY